MPPSRVRIPPSPLRSTERCPSGLRSATGNRVRAERCVAGSNPALSVLFLGSHKMSEPINVWEYERLAEAKLDANAHAYFAGGAGDEVTLRENLAAFERRKLRPRVLVDVEAVTTKTTVLATELALPVLIAPLAMQRMAHPDGEEATARAAAAAGTIMCLSSAATCAPGELPADGPRWFQVYVWRPR